MQYLRHWSMAMLHCTTLLLSVHTVSFAQVPPGDVQVKLQTLVGYNPPTAGNLGEISPVDLIPLDDGTGRMLLSSLAGTIRVLAPDSHAGLSMLNDPLLNRQQTGGNFIGEAGSTGIAIHRDFAAPGTFGFGKFYTITAETRDSGTADFAITANENHQAVVREWNLGSVVGNPNVNSLPLLQKSDSREVLRIDRPGAFHGVFDLVFDDDGLLYITSGDGGTQFDPDERAQNRSNIYGDILRIDPDPTAHALVRTSANTGLAAYSIPSSNPYNGDDAMETRLNSLPENSQTVTLAEIFVNGVRSPYRLTMDRGDQMGAGRGDLYLGDVGQDSYEEVTRIPAGNGGQNLGWPYREGAHAGPQAVNAPPGFSSLDPNFELAHQASEGFTVVGGFVYRGSAIPELYGKYVFAELGQDASGPVSPVPYARLYYGDPGTFDQFFSFDLSRSLERYTVVDRFNVPSQAPLPERIISIGEDFDGELYLVAIAIDPRMGGGQDARIIRLTAAPLPGDLNDDEIVTPADWNLFKAGQGSDFSGLDYSQAWRHGDMDADFDHDLNDFVLFREFYDDANGGGAFNQMLANTPEPASGAMALLALMWGLCLRRCRGSFAASPRSRQA